MNGNTCDKCFSDRLGYICACGEMRCSCEREPCPTCEQHREFREEQDKYQQEKEDRERFEEDMQRKYH